MQQTSKQHPLKMRRGRWVSPLIDSVTRLVIRASAEHQPAAARLVRRLQAAHGE